MPRTLHTHGEYPSDWKAISDASCSAVGNRCIRCRHPYTKGTHGKGQWTPCDERCNHGGPIQNLGGIILAEWRILTVHHMDGNKANCIWWNLLPLCQRCHLQIQTRLNPQQPYILEHSDWIKPYVAGFYAKKYEGRELSFMQVISELDRLLAFERIA